MDGDDIYDENDELFGTSHLPRVSSSEGGEFEPSFQQFIYPDFDKIDELLKNGVTANGKENPQNENDSASSTASTISTSLTPSRESSSTPSATKGINMIGGGEDKENNKKSHKQSDTYQLSSDNGTKNVRVANGQNYQNGNDEAEDGNEIKKTFSKAVPMDPSETWDFSLRSLNPDYKSKCVWMEGPFYKKLHDECLHEMYYLQCPCDQRKRIPMCRLCHIPLCSTDCFKKTSRAQTGIKSKQTDIEDRRLSTSTLGMEHQSQAQPRRNEGRNLKPSWNRKQRPMQGGDYNSTVARGKFLYTENRMDMETKEGTRKFQNRHNQRDHIRGGDSRDPPQRSHQQQLHTGYNNHGPRATLNNMTIAANVSVARGQIDKSRGLLPLPPASTALIPTGIGSSHQQNIFQNPLIPVKTQAQMNPQLRFPLAGQQLMNELNANSQQIRVQNLDKPNIVGKSTCSSRSIRDSPGSNYLPSHPTTPRNKSSVDGSAGLAITHDHDYPAPVKILRNPKPCMHQQNIPPEQTDGIPHNSSVRANPESNTRRFSNNSTEDFNQPGYNKRNDHNNPRTSQQTNNQNSKSTLKSGRGSNSSNFPPKLPNTGSSVQKQQPGSSSRRYATSGSDRQQNNAFNKSQKNLNFRQHTKDTVTEVSEYRPGDPLSNSGSSRSNSHSSSYKSARSNMSTSSSARLEIPASSMSSNEKKLELMKAEPDIPYGVLIQVKHINGKSFYDFAGIPIGNEATAMQIESILQTCPKDRMEVFEYNDYCIVNAPSETGNGGEWYRAIITKIVGKVGVYLLDLGVSTIVDLKAIYKLPTELWNYRPLAIRVKCLNIKADMNDPDVCDYFSSLVEDRIVKVKITHKVPWESFMYAGHLEVMHINKWFDVGTLLEKFQVAESVSGSENTEGLQKLQEVKSSSENTISCSADGTVQATVSYVVSVNEFYISTEKSVRRRYKIEEILNNHCILSKYKRITTLKDLAHPLFTLRDEASGGKHVRVKVMEVEGPETVIVQKIDYGDILTVRIADLKKLPADLHEPSCIFKCSLPVKPVPKSRRSDSAQPMAYDDLTNILVKLCDQPVLLFMYSIENSNTHIVELALDYNSTGCAYSFVNKGWVALSHDVDLNCMKRADGGDDER